MMPLRPMPLTMLCFKNGRFVTEDLVTEPGHDWNNSMEDREIERPHTSTDMVHVPRMRRGLRERRDALFVSGREFRGEITQFHPVEHDLYKICNISATEIQPMRGPVPETLRKPTHLSLKCSSLSSTFPFFDNLVSSFPPSFRSGRRLAICRPVRT